MASTGKLRLVVDTNIWISYLISEQQSPLHSILLSEGFETITSSEGDSDLLVLEQFEKTKIILLADFIKQEAG